MTSSLPRRCPALLGKSAFPLAMVKVRCLVRCLCLPVVQPRAWVAWLLSLLAMVFRVVLCLPAVALDSAVLAMSPSVVRLSNCKLGRLRRWVAQCLSRLAVAWLAKPLVAT